MKMLFYFGMFSVFFHFYPFYAFILSWSVVCIIFIALCWDMAVEVLRLRANHKIE
jgi:hypothetical protein